MPFFLRKIQKRKWDRTPDLAWVPQGDLPADPLYDLRTEENQLSVFMIRDDRSNLDQVVVAIAAKWERLDNFDYALFDQETVARLRIDLHETAGDTPDAAANRWHRDLVNLTGQKLVALAVAIWACGERQRKLQKEMKRLLAEAVSSGRIDPNALTPELRKKICV